MSEQVGTITTPEGETTVVGYLKIARDEREVVIAKLGDGSYAFETKSWLLINDRKEVRHSLRFSEKTMIMLMEVMHLGSLAWNIDMEQQIRALAESDTELQFEYGGDISGLTGKLGRNQ